MVSKKFSGVSLTFAVGLSYVSIIFAVVALGSVGIYAISKLQTQIEVAGKSSAVLNRLRLVKAQVQGFVMSDTGEGLETLQQNLSETRDLIADMDRTNADASLPLQTNFENLSGLLLAFDESRKSSNDQSASLKEHSDALFRLIVAGNTDLRDTASSLTTAGKTLNAPFVRGAQLEEAADVLRTSLGEVRSFVEKGQVGDVPPEVLQNLKKAVGAIKFKAGREGADFFKRLSDKARNVEEIVGAWKSNAPAETDAAVGVAALLEVMTAMAVDLSDIQSILADAFPQASAAITQIQADADIVNSASVHLNTALSSALEYRLAVQTFIDEPETSRAEAIEAALKKIRVRLESAAVEVAKSTTAVEIGTRLTGTLEQLAADIPGIVSAILAASDKQSALVSSVEADMDVISSTIVAGVDAIQEESVSSGKQAVALIVIALILSVMLAFAGAAFVLMRLVRPLRSLATAMTSLGAGKTDIVPQGLDRRDELGIFARAMEDFKASIIARNGLEEANRSEQQDRATRQARVEEMIASFRERARSLITSVEESNNVLQRSAERLGQSAHSASSKATPTLNSCGEADKNVTIVATAAEELTASLGVVDRDVSQTTSIVREATALTKSANSKITELESATRQIDQVVNLISDIAEQTNLLALNATIEAARAGEAGKGFSVVASEVKTLANQTAKATQEIGHKIGAIQQSVSGAVTSIDSIAKVIDQLSETANAMASNISQQFQATNEISESATRASADNKHALDNVVDIIRSVDDTAKVSDEVLDVTRTAASTNATLSREIEDFLNDVVNR
ncbi:MAG: HAMP domain-containing protein [Rhizobiales bacterium]|nr:HAMP domain-containing protein [Hyphomicrobiales bacterium]